MLKKIILWTVFAGFAGLMIFGAINRTNAKSGTAAQDGHNNRQTDGLGGGLTVESSQQGSRNGQTDSETRGKNSQSLTGQSDNEPLAQAKATEWITLFGEVISVDENALLVDIGAGDPLEITGRAWKYAQEMGFTTTAGDQLELLGFYEGEDFEVGGIDDITTGLSVALREENGRPLWAGGRGRRGGE